MAHVFHFPACLKSIYTQTLKRIFFFWCHCVFQATPLPRARLSFLCPEVSCVTTIRRLFLEIYDSFSEIRRDLCSSYFYCKSNSLGKKCNLYESFIFILACVKGDVLGRAEESQEGSSISLGLKWSVALPASLAYHVLTVWVACCAFCSVSSESLLLLFSWPWMIPSSTDRASRTGNAVLEQSLVFKSGRGLPFTSRATLGPASDTDEESSFLETKQGHRSSWGLLCRPWDVLACMPRKNVLWLGTGICLLLGHLSIT